MDIRDYIELAKTKPNESEGGSPCYIFDDVVLVKYSMANKYKGIARPTAEAVAEAANQKNAMGIRTPRHIAVLREQDEDVNTCWVLQERSKGVCYKKYVSYGSSEERLAGQRLIAAIPQEHFDKLIHDVCALKELYFELKPKNVFYDPDKENGGFIIIDLLGGDNYTPFDGSLQDILFVKSSVRGICGQMLFLDDATPEQKEESRNLLYEAEIKMFRAMQKSIPNFKKYERMVLRTYSKEELDYFRENGAFDQDLTLTEGEMSDLEERCEAVAKKAAELYLNGELELWEVKANYIRIESGRQAIETDCKFLPGMSESRLPDEDDYDFEIRQRNAIFNKIYGMFLSYLPESERRKIESGEQPGEQ